MKKPLRSLAGRVLATSDDPAEKSLAAYVLQDSETDSERERSEGLTGGSSMTNKTENKVTDPKKIDVEAAKQVVEQDRKDSKDGVAIEKVDPVSGYAMKPQSPDKSVLTYNPEEAERVDPPKPEKSKYKSGEPVHDRE